MINVAIIGFGSRGQMFGRKIKADENVQLLAIADSAEACPWRQWVPLPR